MANEQTWRRAAPGETFAAGSIVKFYDGDSEHKVLSIDAQTGLMKVAGMKTGNVFEMLPQKVWGVKYYEQ